MKPVPENNSIVRSSQHLILWTLLLTGLLLRLMYSFVLPVEATLQSGGDSFWYLSYGAASYTGQISGVMHGLPYHMGYVPTPPLYLLFAGFWQQIFSLHDAILVIRMLQALMGVVVCGLSFYIVRWLGGDGRAGLIAAGALALSPAYVTEAAKVQTESLYILLVVAGIAAYLKAWHTENYFWRWLMLCGVLLGLGTLTRAVLLLFPVGLAGHWLLFGLADKHGIWQRRLTAAVMLLIIYSAVVSTWTVYNLAYHDRFVIASDQFSAALWRGATTEDASPAENDELLAGNAPQAEAQRIITSDPLAYARLRVSELAAAYLQPHGTIPFGSESLKDAALNWVRSGFQWSAFQELITGEGFFIKSLIYIWHYLAMGGTLLALWLKREQWRVLLVPGGFILYTSLLHLILLALPRYIFPVEPFLWCLAALAFLGITRRMRQPSDANIPGQS
jgi:4-amino-4-deoxy-L-arabinose transferase-like glycosyltransferase